MASTPAGDFQDLARQFLDDAKALRANRRYNGAAYMCGYALEMGLKAAICKRLALTEYPPNGFRKPEVFKTHVPDDLKVLAGLGAKLPPKTDRRLAANWDLVSGWSPEWRYQAAPKSQTEAEAMIRALEDPNHGVLTWLMKKW